MGRGRVQRKVGRGGAGQGRDRAPADADAAFRQGRQMRAVKGLEACRRHLECAAPAQQASVEEDRDLGQAQAGAGQCAGQVGQRIAARVQDQPGGGVGEQRQLCARQDHRFGQRGAGQPQIVEDVQQQGQRRAGVIHRVGAVQDHEGIMVGIERQHPPRDPAPVGRAQVGAVQRSGPVIRKPQSRVEMQHVPRQGRRQRRPQQIVRGAGKAVRRHGGQRLARAADRAARVDDADAHEGPPFPDRYRTLRRCRSSPAESWQGCASDPRTDSRPPGR